MPCRMEAEMTDFEKLELLQKVIYRAVIKGADTREDAGFNAQVISILAAKDIKELLDQGIFTSAPSPRPEG